MNVTRSFLREWTGPFTEELKLESGRFGLGQVPARLNPEKTTRSICGFCATGCSLDVHLRNGAAVSLTPTADYPVNLGMACPKGWEALAPLSAEDRATTPLIRAADGKLHPATWHEAMSLFVGRFKEIMARHGNESVAFLGTGQICTEEMALLGALFKFGMGGLHCDSNTRQCMATAHVPYKQSFGFDAPPYTYADFEASDVLVFVGANPCIAHPIMWQRVLRNRNQPKIIVVDPRRTETAMNATQHLALQPKSDLTLLYGVANLLVQNGWVNRPFIADSTKGYESFAAFVRQFTPGKVASVTGLTVGEIHRFAEAIHLGKAVSFWWTMGVNQGHEATRTAQAIINLALMTGNIGRPGTGANSITGQCNAMGSRLYSNTTSLFGGRDFRNADHRREVAALLGIGEHRIPASDSLAYDQILERVGKGTIKALWVVATNTAHSWIDQRTFSRAANQLEFLVVQDMYPTTETAQQADMVLPTAGWGEKEGTFINSERRIGLVKKVARAPGQALSDFNIFRMVAQYWGCGSMFDEWQTPEAVFKILRRLSANRPCDITGISGYEMLDACGGIQWPFPERQKVEVRRQNEEGRMKKGEGRRKEGSNGDDEDPSSFCLLTSAFQERRLFTEGKFFTEDERARFMFDPPRPVAEIPDGEYPFVLLTGRGTSAQWHTNTRTGKSAVLRALYPQKPYVELNPADAQRLGVLPNQPVQIVSRRASVECTAFVTPTVQAGHIFIPMHYRVTNQLTRAEFDPNSRQPSYKHCAVRLERNPG